MRHIYRADLQRVLMDAFAACGGRVLSGHRLRWLEQDGSGVTASFYNGTQISGDLLVGPDISVSPTNTAGQATWSVPLPADPGLVGLAFYNQGVVLDPGTNPLGAVVSNGGAGRVGGK